MPANISRSPTHSKPFNASELASLNVIARMEDQIASLIISRQEMGTDLENLEDLHGENQTLAKRNREARDRLSVQLEKEAGVADLKRLMKKADETIKDFNKSLYHSPKPTLEQKFRMGEKVRAPSSETQRAAAPSIRKLAGRGSVRGLAGLGQHKRSSSSSLRKLARLNRMTEIASLTTSISLATSRLLGRVFSAKKEKKR